MCRFARLRQVFDGDTVLLRGKKRRDTLAVAREDPSLAGNQIAMGTATRKNLRLKMGDIALVQMPPTVKNAAVVQVSPRESPLPRKLSATSIWKRDTGRYICAEC